jgi:hypothetical protein
MLASDYREQQKELPYTANRLQAAVNGAASIEKRE